MTFIDGQGFHKSTRAERLADLQTAFVATYGTDISIEPGTPDGDWLVEQANRISDADDLVEKIYLMRSPSAATGATLSRLALLTGVSRKPAQFSTAPVTLGGTAGTVIPIGSLVGSDGLDQNGKNTWTAVAAYTVGVGGTVTGQVQAQNSGPVLAQSGHINIVKSVIAGWTSVTSTADASPGTDVETDAALRVRRTASVALPSQGLVDSMYSALGQLDNVTSVAVYENFTESTDTNGLPPHSINALVDGGADADIAETMWLRKGQGCTLKGDQTYTIFDAQGNPQIMRWDRPAGINVYIIVNLDSPAGSDVHDAIINNLVAWGNGTLKDVNGNVVSAGSQIGRNVVWSQLFVPLNMTAVLDIGSLYLGSAPSPSAQANLVIPFNAIARWHPENIIVTGP